MFEPPSQANDINQIQKVQVKSKSQWLGFPCNCLRTCCFESQTVPAPCSRNEAPVDIGSKQHNGYGHRGKHEFRLLMASTLTSTWQGMMIVLRSYTYLLVHLMCWMPRMPPEFLPMLCKFCDHSVHWKMVYQRHGVYQPCTNVLVHALLTHTSEGLVHNFDHGSLGSDLCCDQAHLHCWWFVSQWPN